MASYRARFTSPQPNPAGIGGALRRDLGSDSPWGVNGAVGR